LSAGLCIVTIFSHALVFGDYVEVGKHIYLIVNLTLKIKGFCSVCDHFDYTGVMCRSLYFTSLTCVAI
jgi:hypothetical protein